MYDLFPVDVTMVTVIVIMALTVRRTCPVKPASAVPAVTEYRVCCILALCVLLPYCCQTYVNKLHFPPKSLSTSTMLKLGKVASNESEVTVIDIFKFDKEFMTWSVLPVKADRVCSFQRAFWRGRV